jgi:hypothetical protein
VVCPLHRVLTDYRLGPDHVCWTRLLHGSTEVAVADKCV